MHSLSVEQQQGLIKIIHDEHGANLVFDDFTEAMLGLFDEIPGFEAIPSTKANQYINLLWREYHDQKSV